MGEQIRTLVLEANGFGWRPILVDTFARGILGIHDITRLPVWLQGNPLARRALKFHYDGLSYVLDWREAICDSPGLDVTVCNINDLTSYSKWMKAIKGFELIVILHSAAGDDMTILLRTAKWFLERKGKLVVFIGNEYDLMDEKIKFLNKSQADYVCSQLPINSAKWLYSDCANTQVLEMPHALNAKLYHPDKEERRNIDLGFRGMPYPLFIGDIERQSMLEYFDVYRESLNLNIDIHYKKLGRVEWAHFLQTCQGVIGAEAGTHFLDRKGRMISSAKKYIRKHPKATLVEIQNLFKNNPEQYVSGKAISSRHFEPIGTKTCQVLLEGEYNGILKPGLHYISIKKDFSNVTEAIDLFKNVDYRKRIVEQAYELVMNSHTYRHRIETLISIITA